MNTNTRLSWYAAFITGLLALLSWLIIRYLPIEWNFFLYVFLFGGILAAAVVVFRFLFARAGTSQMQSDLSAGVQKNNFETETQPEISGDHKAQTPKEEIAELKKLELFRKEFLGNVSHELKTPIFNIQGYIHTLLDGAVNDDEVNMQYLRRAARSAERLGLIVEDLEAISKLEAGELLLDQRMFDIYELVKDVFDSSELKAREKKISLIFKKGSDRSVYVYADKERIRQVVVNLIVNSIKYGKEGGTTTTSIVTKDDVVRVEISDNGIGIEPKHLPRIFERFYRVDKSRSREAGGTGLGLAIVKHIMEAHQQTISVKSTYGAGTTFTLTLQRAN